MILVKKTEWKRLGPLWAIPLIVLCFGDEEQEPAIGERPADVGEPLSSSAAVDPLRLLQPGCPRLPRRGRTHPGGETARAPGSC